MSDATVSETEDLKEHVHVKETVPAVSEPEEWDGDDTPFEGSITILFEWRPFSIPLWLALASVSALISLDVG
jgi:hypothetical protein